MARAQADAARQQSQPQQRPKKKKKKKKPRPQDEFQEAEAHPEGSKLSPLDTYEHEEFSPFGQLTLEDLRRAIMLVEVLGPPPGFDDEDLDE